MNTYGLLDFELVDRINERNELIKFIRSDTRCLWINGALDTGKTFFATNFRWKDYNYEYIHTEVAGQSEYNLYENIVCELNKKVSYSFRSFILSNYTGLYNIAKNTISSSIENIVLKDHDLLKNLYNELILLVDKDGKNKSAAKVLAQYIYKINTDKPLALIIDDASAFDNDNFILLKELLLELIGFEKIKIIIITNKEDENRKINDFLMNNLSCGYMLMEPFTDNIFFAEIILPKFPDDKKIMSYIPKIFDICKGYPEKLKNLFQNLLLEQKQAFQIYDSHIAINYDHFENCLNNYYEVGIKGFSFLEQLILKLLVPATFPISINFLIKETVFIGEKIIFHTFEYLQIYDSINNLIALQFLKKYQIIF